MSSYLEFDFKVNPSIPGTDILISELADAGFESFEETNNGCKAWIPAESYDDDVFDSIVVLKSSEFHISYEVKMIAPVNWNAVWESSFEPVITDQCIIRAPFHMVDRKFEYEVVILPQMSFGTGHHETTSLMVAKLLTMDLREKEVLDMGCGTGVLAILASMKGAAKVWAVDNNTNAVENTLENITLNKTERILVHKGDAAILQGKVFHVIFANINRNVLLADMESYAGALNEEGSVFLSGFFETDIPQILDCCERYGLKEKGRAIKNGWALLEVRKD